MPENGDPSGPRADRVQEFEAFGAEFGLKDGRSRDVSAGPGETRDVAGSYRICMAHDDDGDRRGRCFQGPREERAPRYEQVRLDADQVRRELGEPSGVALEPPVLDPDVHAVLPAALPQNLPQCLPHTSLVGVRGSV